LFIKINDVSLKHQIGIIMEAVHNVNYEGIDFEVVGDYEEPEIETGYKGGFSYSTLSMNGTDVSWMLNEHTIDAIVQIINDENY